MRPTLLFIVHFILFYFRWPTLDLNLVKYKHCIHADCSCVYFGGRGSQNVVQDRHGCVCGV